MCQVAGALVPGSAVAQCLHLPRSARSGAEFTSNPPQLLAPQQVPSAPNPISSVQQKRLRLCPEAIPDKTELDAVRPSYSRDPDWEDSIDISRTQEPGTSCAAAAAATTTTTTTTSTTTSTTTTTTTTTATGATAPAAATAHAPTFAYGYYC